MLSKFIKLKSWYFIVAIMMFFIVIGIISNRRIKNMPLPSEHSSLIKVDRVDFDNEKLSFVFFHNPDSELSEKMRFKVERLSEIDQETIDFYSIDVNKNPKSYYQHNVSGIPNILIFKGDKEIKRIMGVVPYKNLTRIVQRIENEYGREQ